MKNENLQVSFAPGCEKAELVIREVAKVNELEVKAPLKIGITGTIGAPVEFLAKRFDQPDQIDPKKCHVLVNREKISITLITHEDEEYLRGQVTGSLSMNSKFEEFSINGTKVWTPEELGLFIKMNRSFFVDRNENMTLVTELMNYKATVNSQVVIGVSTNGSKTDNFEQVVNSNLPKSFSIKISIFKGMNPETIEVETYAKVSGRDISFILISPDAAAIEEDIRDRVIEEQLTAIRAISPDIAIIEQ